LIPTVDFGADSPLNIVLLGVVAVRPAEAGLMLLLAEKDASAKAKFETTAIIAM